MSQLRRLQQALMLGLAMMLMACGRDALTAPRAVAPTVRHLRWATQLADTLFGPHEFERGLGRPKADTAHFAAPDRETVSFSFTSSNRQGLAGTVELDGAILFTITDTTTLPAVRQAVAQPSATL